MEFEDKIHDVDSSRDVWERLYSKIYRNTFGQLFDFDSLDDTESSDKCKRWYIKIRKERPEYQVFPKFKISGDCIFNFNEKKLMLFKNMINEDDRELLDKCHASHHSLVNFSFMPITGGLNNTKGTIRCREGIEKTSLDRPDVLIKELDIYYGEGKNERIFARNRKALEWYLSLFKDEGIKGYCRKIYLIDDERLLERFITGGAKPVCDSESAREYMNLALDYWRMKEEKLAEYGIKEY